MLGLALLATVLASSASAAPATSVPFDLVDNRIVVQARLNGHGPFSMIVDTGSPVLTVTPEVAHSLHLKAKPAGFVNGAGSGQLKVALAKISELRIGQVSIRNDVANVIDLGPIRRAIGFPRLDGIIGYHELKQLNADVDMDTQKLTLSAKPLPAPKSAKTIPFRLASGFIYVPVVVNGNPGTALLDTGDRSSLTVFKQFATRHHLYDSPNAVRNVVTGFGIGGPVYSDVFRTGVDLFESKFDNVLTRASRDRGGVFATSTLTGSIGNGLLKRFNIIYDYPHRRLIVWPSRFYNVGQRYDASGMWLSESTGGPIVSAVSAQSVAAKAGIRVGDSIFALNGNPTRKRTLPEIRDWLLSQRDGTLVSFSVRRANGAMETKTLVLRDTTMPSAPAGAIRM